MELEFKKTSCDCLRECVREVQNGEETLEIRIPDGSADIGRVIAAWGQPVLRGKEWRSGQINISCGMMVWVLYLEEESLKPRCLEGWIPYQLRWDIPQNTREGTIRVGLLTRFVDARSTSARKVMVRAGLGALLQAMTGETNHVYIPGESQQLQLLPVTYPVRLIREAGEKSFQVTETLRFPASVPLADKLYCYTVSPEITEQKLIGSRLVFKGNANLHVLYEAENGQLHTWDFSVPFSQHAQLETLPGADNWLDVRLCPSNLELQRDDEGFLQLKLNLVGQYLIEEQVLQEVVSDAYFPGRITEPQFQELELPTVLDCRWEQLSGEQTLAGNANAAVDVRMITDYPLRQISDGRTRLEIPQSVQILYYGENGTLESASARWESCLDFSADTESGVTAVPGTAAEPNVLLNGDSMVVQWQCSMQVRTVGNSHIPMVSSVRIGEEKTADPEGPSLILRRSGSNGLWELAKQTGATVEAIRSANCLQGDPQPGQLLLIPIPG